MEKIEKWVFEKINEFILFLEYPLEYIEEVGDKLKTKNAAGKTFMIAKMAITAYVCVQLVLLGLFVIILFEVLGVKRSDGGNAYTDALKQEKREAEKRGDSSGYIADLEQEIRNNER